MTITLASIVAAYDALGTLVTATTTAKAVITALGARPTYPTNVTADSQYNTPDAAIATYDAAFATAQASWVAAVNTQKAQELVVKALMPTKQWITCAALANWGAASTQYIGVKGAQKSNADNVSGANLYNFITSATLPTLPFPNV